MASRSEHLPVLCTWVWIKPGGKGSLKKCSFGRHLLFCPPGWDNPLNTRNKTLLSVNVEQARRMWEVSCEGPDEPGARAGARAGAAMLLVVPAPRVPMHEELLTFAFWWRRVVWYQAQASPGRSHPPLPPLLCFYPGWVEAPRCASSHPRLLRALFPLLNSPGDRRKNRARFTVLSNRGGGAPSPSGSGGSPSAMNDPWVTLAPSFIPGFTLTEWRGGRS